MSLNLIKDLKTLSAPSYFNSKAKFKGFYNIDDIYYNLSFNIFNLTFNP
jgi:hypothetical protein